MKLIKYLLAMLFCYICIASWFLYFAEFGLRDWRYWLGSFLPAIGLNLFAYIVKKYDL